MIILKVLLIASSTCLKYIATSDTRKNSTLILSHVIFRHGDRTPIQDELGKTQTNLTLNLYNENAFYPYGMGELNLKGKKRSYRLGLSLRQRYKRFLGDIYDNNIVEGFSSDYPRTQMSLQLVLAALFPPLGKWKIFTGLKWQPAYYKIIKSKYDNIIGIHNTCPKIMFVDVDRSNNVEMYNVLRQNTRINANNFILGILIENSINVQVENGMDVSEWARPFWPEPIKSAAKIEYKSVIIQHISTITGVLSKKILTDSEMMINGTLPQGRKIFLYSGHDINVLAFLALIGNYKNHYAQYTSHILIELHKIDDVFGFKIFYQNYQTYKPKLLHIKGCDKFCPVEEFAKIVNNVYKGDNYCV